MVSSGDRRRARWRAADTISSPRTSPGAALSFDPRASSTTSPTRAVSSSSSSMMSVRRASRSSGDRSFSSRISWRLARIVAIGVRSSWEASATRLRCAWTDSSSASSVRLNVWASRASSSPPWTSMRSRSRRSGLAAIRSVCRVKRAIGASAVRATRTPSSAARAIPAAAMITSSISWWRSASSTWVSGSATWTAPCEPTPDVSTRRWVEPTVASLRKLPRPLLATSRTSSSTGSLVVSWLARQTEPVGLTSWTKPEGPPNVPPRALSRPSPWSQSLTPPKSLGPPPGLLGPPPPPPNTSSLPGPWGPGTTPARTRIGCTSVFREVSSCPVSSERVPAYTDTATATTATATASPAASPIRARKLTSDLHWRGSDSRGLPQRVAHPPNRMDQRAGAGVLQLAPQVADVDTQRVGGRAEVISPHAVVDEAVGEHPARVEHEQFQQLVFGPGELDERAGDLDPVAGGIQLELLERQPAVDVPLPAGTAQQCPDPSPQLIDVKRLDQVVIGPGVEPVDPVRNGITRRQHEHRNPVALPPEQPAHLQPVDVRQADVKHHRVRDGARHLEERVGAGLRQHHLVAGQAQRPAQHISQAPVIVDDEQSHSPDCGRSPGRSVKLLLFAYPGSAARSRRTAPRIPLMNAGAPDPQNRLAVSIASSMAPSGGIGCSLGTTSG